MSASPPTARSARVLAPRHLDVATARRAGRRPLTRSLSKQGPLLFIGAPDAEDTSRQFRLLDLPLEIICHIFNYLAVSYLLRCTQTCKFLRQSIKASSKLQYKIELFSHRVAALPGRTSLLERRRQLQEREHAWKSLTWKERHKLDLDHTGGVYEYVSDVYANGCEDERRVAAAISFFRLPIATAPQPEIQKWTHTMGDLSIVDFTMDPAQDLLVLVAHAPPGSTYLYEVHPRTLSTNEPHPQAPPGCVLRSLRKELVHDETWSSVRVQLSGDFLALLVKEVLESGNGAHLNIWNWKTGPKNCCTMMLEQGADDFCFLSPNRFLLVCPSGWLELCTFRDPARGSNVAECRRRFQLPEPAPRHFYWYLTLSCNPPAGYFPGRAAAGATAYPLPDERTLACCMYVHNPLLDVEVVHPFVLFMHLSFFVSLPLYADGPATTPWRAWGPSETRFFNEQMSTDWQHALHGHRTVETVGEGTRRQIRVRDFNPVAIARAEEEGAVVVREPSTTKSGTVFPEDIVTSLPYTEVVSGEVDDVTDVMMDDCRILLLKRGEAEHVVGIDVLTM